MQKKPRMAEFFCGMGNFRAGFDQAGWETVYSCEWDKHKRKIYEVIYGEPPTSSDICDVNGMDIPDAECWTFGAPCITADSLILTQDGYKEMKDIKVGDMVLTKSNTWHPVKKIFDNGVAETRYLSGVGFLDIHCTNEHKFWVRKVSYKKDNHIGRKLEAPAFEQADKLNGACYMGIPVIEEEKPFYSDSPTFWFLMGKMFRHDDFDDADSDNELIKFHRETFGLYAYEKNIPMSVITLPKELLKSFLVGLVSNDCWHKGLREYKQNVIEPVNAKSAYAISLIVNKLFHVPANIEYSNKFDAEFLGCDKKYRVKFYTVPTTKWKSIYEDGYIWLRLERSMPAKSEHVYNIEVEEDHSYVLHGVISKNCQDFSVAGLRAGLDGDRSSLVREVFRLIKERPADRRPEWLVYENVKGMLSSNQGWDFAAIQAEMGECGYDVTWQLFNSKDWGVPQNRERIYTVGHRRDRGDLDIFPIKVDAPLRHIDAVYKLSEDISSNVELFTNLSTDWGNIPKEDMKKILDLLHNELHSDGKSYRIPIITSDVPQDNAIEGSLTTIEVDSDKLPDDVEPIGVVSIPTDDLLLCWFKRDRFGKISKYIPDDYFDAQKQLVDKIKSGNCKSLLLAVQSYQGHLFYSIGDGEVWVKVYNKEVSKCEVILSSILEEDVPEKYFLSDKVTQRLLSYKDTNLEPLQGGQPDEGILRVNGFHKQ